MKYFKLFFLSLSNLIASMKASIDSKAEEKLPPDCTSPEQAESPAVPNFISHPTLFQI